MIVSPNSIGYTANTALGQGVIKKVSTAQSSIHLEMGGQMYEVPFKDVFLIKKGTDFFPNEEDQPKDFKEYQRFDFKQEFFTKTKKQQQLKYEEVERLRREFQDAIEQKQKRREQEQREEEQESKQEEENEVPEKDKKAGIDLLGEYLGTIDERITTHVAEKIDAELEGKLKHIKDAVKANQKLEVVVDGKSKIVKGTRHKQLDELITICQLRLPALMVGMAGTGKTHAAEQVAEGLGIKFYAMSVGAQTSKSDIIGYMNANGDYVNTHFRTAYEKGGVFLMDELDAGNANVLIQVNAALSNGQAAFPDKMVKMHKNFVFIATANTYGTGMDRQYIGRNQLDAATLDRFTLVDWDIDDKLEESLAVGKDGAKWYKAVRASRDYIKEHAIRALVTPRATVKGSKLLSAGVKVESVVNATILNSVPDDRKQAVADVALKVYRSKSKTDEDDIFKEGVPF